jgi:hypothetical protein
MTRLRKWAIGPAFDEFNNRASRVELYETSAEAVDSIEEVKARRAKLLGSRPHERGPRKGSPLLRLAVNLTTAKALGLAVPPSNLLRARNLRASGPRLRPPNTSARRSCTVDERSLLPDEV